jgi:hypothetical protein
MSPRPSRNNVVDTGWTDTVFTTQGKASFLWASVNVLLPYRQDIGLHQMRTGILNPLPAWRSTFLFLVLVVLSFGPFKKVTAANACWIVTLVEDADALWEWRFLGQAKSHSMGQNRPMLESEFTVAVFVSRRDPDPASRPRDVRVLIWIRKRPPLIDLAPKPRTQWFCVSVLFHFILPAGFNERVTYG